LIGRGNPFPGHWIGEKGTVRFSSEYMDPSLPIKRALHWLCSAAILLVASKALPSLQSEECATRLNPLVFEVRMEQLSQSSSPNTLVSTLPSYLKALLKYSTGGGPLAFVQAEAAATQLSNRLRSYRDSMEALRARFGSLKGISPTDRENIRRHIQGEANRILTRALAETDAQPWPSLATSNERPNAAMLFSKPTQSLVPLDLCQLLMERSQSGGLHLEKPTYLKRLEHWALPTVLRSLFATHAKQNKRSLFENSLLDVGAWDGRKTRAISTGIFGKVVAIEPDWERFDALQSREIPGLIAQNIALDAFAKKYQLEVDAILMSHMLYFLIDPAEGELNDLAALSWGLENTNATGIVVAVINDMDASIPSSRAHLRNRFKAPETNPLVSRYTNHLASLPDVHFEVLYPEIRLSYDSENGKQALRDLLVYMLPKNQRANEAEMIRKLDEYIAAHVRPTQSFTHRLAILVASKQPVSELVHAVTHPTDTAPPMVGLFEALLSE
jgi:hypothetical protein